MSLPPEQRSEIRFNRGTDESEYAEVATEQFYITNGEFAREGGLQRRRGFATLDTPSAALVAARGLVRTRNGALLLGKNIAKPQQRDGAFTGAFFDYWHGNVRTVAQLAGSVDASAGENTFSECDAALMTSNGRTLACIIASTKQAAVRYVVVDVERGTALASGELESTAFMARVVTIGSSFIIYYTVTGASIKQKSLAISGTTVTAATATCVTAAIVGGLASFDAYAAPGAAYAILAYVVGVNIVVSKHNSSGTSLATVSIAHGGGTHRLGVVEAADGTIHVADGGDATSYRIFRITAAFSHTTTTTPTGQTARTIRRIAIGTNPLSAATGLFVVAYDASNDVTCWANLDTAHVQVSADTAKAGVAPLSKPFIEYSTASTLHDRTEPMYACVLGTVDSSFGSDGVVNAANVCRFVVDPLSLSTSFAHDYFEPLATLLNDGGFAYTASSAFTRGGMLPAVTQVAAVDDKDEAAIDWYIPQLHLIEQLNTTGFPVGPNSALSLVYGAKLLRLEHAMNDPLPRAQIAGAGFVGGGLLRIADGAGFGEAAFVRQPPAVTTTDAGAGSLDAGTYYWQVVFIYEDAYGNIRRSAPSTPVSRTLAASHCATVTVTHNLMTNYITPTGGAINGMAGRWRVEVYRTDADGAEPKLVEVRGVDPSGSFTFTDNTADSLTAANKVLYTELELQAEPAPPMSALCAHQNRLWGVDATDRRTIVFSKEVADGFVPEFNGVLKLRLDAANDDIQQLVSMDDKLIAFTKSDAYAITGAGPDANGTGAFNVPEKVCPVGVSSPYAAVSTPVGILFHNGAGMFVLGRDLQLTDVSGPVTNILGRGAAPLAAAHVPAVSCVYFLLGGNDRDGGSNSPSCVVFDYARGHARWLVHTNMTAGVELLFLDVVDIDGTPHFVLANPDDTVAYVQKRDTTAYADDLADEYIPVEVAVTNWRPGGLLDEVRVRRVHVLVTPDDTPGNDDQLTLTAARARQPRDFGSDTSEEFSWTPAEYADGGYGHVSTRLRYQRLNAVSFDVELEEGEGTANTPGPVLHGLIVDWAPTGRVARRGPGLGFST